MMPSTRQKALEKAKLEKKEPRRAGVMALFYPNSTGKTNVLLILRKTYKGVHSNQIAFPGGKEEKEDATILQTALRETYEEVGVPKNKIEVVKHLTEVYIPPSNFIVQPFVGFYEKDQHFTIQESEVEQIVEVSLTDFMDDAKIVEEDMRTSYAQKISVPAFKLNGYVVWGATAMMLSEIKELLKQVL